MIGYSGNHLSDEAWLSAAIDISRQSPPVPERFAVGAVVVDGDGSLLATGYTGEGDPHLHAEEAALAKLPFAQDLSRATLYTSLEPCTSRKSRPSTCTDIILTAGVGRVVLAWREPLIFTDCDGVGTLRRHDVTVVEIQALARRVRFLNAHLLHPLAVAR